MKKMTDAEFAAWCAQSKACRYCGTKFTGPVCPCELPAPSAANPTEDKR